MLGPLRRCAARGCGLRRRAAFRAAAAGQWLIGSVAATACGGPHGSCPAGARAASSSADYPPGAAKDIVFGPESPSAAVIFMHGLGDTGDGWEQPMRMLSRALPYARFVLPTAPVLPVSLNGGMPMPAWYDIVGLSSRANEECDGIDGSFQRITDLLTEVVRTGVPYGRIVVAGFSQGGALAMYTALRNPHPLAGVAALSGYLPRPQLLETEGRKLPAGTPMLLCHGTHDTMVRIEWARESSERLAALGLSPRFEEFHGMGHELGQEEFELFAKWLAQVLPPASA
eukprot:TRINITY_DN70228_c0_g1_i1.p1 TRINITY_DN70228_c0_g1~~TRINITY_DN70228_c0_g1_i1.p1  ORF type:complete len:285 (+),score=71.42 TRINITY_DN70228_c0_g1_i1:78-932(+)